GVLTNGAIPFRHACGGRFALRGRDRRRHQAGGTRRRSVMSDSLPLVYLARHGQTAWTISGQHTGVTDLPLTSKGEAEAVWLRTRLDGMKFAAVLTSPLRRAVTTCELAGFGAVAASNADRSERNYGAYERRSSDAIHAERPYCQLFRMGCPEG